MHIRQPLKRHLICAVTSLTTLKHWLKLQRTWELATKSNLLSLLHLLYFTILLTYCKRFERALEVGHLCFDRMENLREQNKERAVKVRERQALLAEKQQLDKLRRKLSAEQAAKLRELEVEDRLAKLQPSYYTETLENYDSWCLDVSKIMVWYIIHILLSCQSIIFL